MTPPDRCDRPGHEYEPATNCRACRSEDLADEVRTSVAGWATTAPPEAIQRLRESLTQHRPQTDERSFATPHIPLTPEPVHHCARCPGGHVAFIDRPAHRASHKTVFGHDPIRITITTAE
jgi:hypothetical protein